MKSVLTVFLLLATAMGFTAADDPKFDFACWDGLYATVTLPKRIEKSAIEDGESMKLQGVPGFQKEIQVRALWQTEGKNRIRRAPLAVPLLGIAGDSSCFGRACRFARRHLDVLSRYPL